MNRNHLELILGRRDRTCCTTENLRYLTRCKWNILIKPCGIARKFFKQNVFKKWDSHVLSRPDFWMVWRCHDILCFYFFIFCLEATLGEGYLDESDFRHCFGSFSKVRFRKFPDHNYVKVSSQQLRGTLTTAFWKTPSSWRFYGHG